MGIDPGRLPYKPLMKETQRESAAQAAQYARRHPDQGEDPDSPRGVRRVVRRLRDAIKRRS